MQCDNCFENSGPMRVYGVDEETGRQYVICFKCENHKPLRAVSGQGWIGLWPEGGPQKSLARIQRPVVAWREDLESDENEFCTWSPIFVGFPQFAVAESAKDLDFEPRDYLLKPALVLHENELQLLTTEEWQKVATAYLQDLEAAQKKLKLDLEEQREVARKQQAESPAPPAPFTPPYDVLPTPPGLFDSSGDGSQQGEPPKPQ